MFVIAIISDDGAAVCPCHQWWQILAVDCHHHQCQSRRVWTHHCHHWMTVRMWFCGVIGWTNIPTFEQQARCPSCNTSPESLEHILLECDHPTTKNIWSLVKNLWPDTSAPWPTINLGVLLSCGSLALPPSEDCPSNKGLSRLLQILLSESVHLIWVIRCKRVIQGTDHSLTAIETRWRNKIDLHITINWHLVFFHKEKSFSLGRSTGQPVGVKCPTCTRTRETPLTHNTPMGLNAGMDPQVQVTL